MCNDFFVPFVKQNKVLHIWDERKIPVITSNNGKYATYSEDRLAIRVDLCSMELFKRKDIYENGVPAELIERSLLVFRNRKCIDSSFRDILLDALPIFGTTDEHDWAISGCIISQSHGGFLNIYDGLLDDSVPSINKPEA